jgi:PHS family inorganic phosphate transporter-like MFS transporter
MAKRTLLSAVGFLTDAYDLFRINLVAKIMAELYPQNTWDVSFITTMALVGSILGQITFGILADRVGRQKMFVTTLVFITIGAFASAFLTSNHTGNIYTQLGICRFILGFGVGQNKTKHKTGKK